MDGVGPLESDPATAMREWRVDSGRTADGARVVVAKTRPEPRT